MIWAGGISRTGQEADGVATLLTASRQSKMVISLFEASDPNGDPKKHHGAAMPVPLQIQQDRHEPTWMHSTMH